TTETRVPLAALADQETAEGAETVTLRVLPGSGGGAVPASGQDAATITIGDGAAAPDLVLASVSPAVIPATGEATLTLSGAGFGDDATVTLSGPASLTAEFVGDTRGGAQALARFVTSGAPTGAYTVTVTSGGETAMLPEAVTVTDAVEGGTTDVWVEVERRTLRDGFRAPITIRYGNDGTADAIGVPMRIAFPASLDPQFVSEIGDLDDPPDWYVRPTDLWQIVTYAPPSTFTAIGSIRTSLSGTSASGGASARAEGQSETDYAVAVLMLPVVPAGGHSEIIVSVLPTSRFEINDPYLIGVGAPFNTLDVDAVESLVSDGDPEVAARVWAASGPRPVNLSSAACASDGLTADALASGLDTAAGNAACVKCLSGIGAIVNAGLTSNPCIRAGLGALSAALKVYADAQLGDGLGIASAIPIEGGLSNFLLAAAACGVATAAPGGLLIQALTLASQTSAVIGSAGTGVACAECIRSEFPGLLDLVSSKDPNDKLGPIGITEDAYVFDLDRAGYTIRFENIETATASAIEVTITDPLDTSVFDLSEFSLGTVVLPDTSFTPPPGLAEWTTFWDRRPAVNSVVRVHGALDRETGVAAWQFSDLDPDTYRLRISADAGFLPPNDATGRGEGSVAFTVGVLPDLPDGTVIANEADIVFDRNEVIRTPLFANTIDQGAPTSRAISAERFDADSSWVVRFEGTDAGAGVRRYDLYAQPVTGGPFVYAASAIEVDSVVFRGQPGLDYGFFALATDWVGNAEPPKTAAEVTTFPVATEPDAALPEAVALAPPYPNPTRGEAVLQIGLPASGPLRAV
ncbi:MAG: IPT/TIG domain-containing protein, partial [Bacteroidota bacterium]